MIVLYLLARLQEIAPFLYKDTNSEQIIKAKPSCSSLGAYDIEDLRLTFHTDATYDNEGGNYLETSWTMIFRSMKEFYMAGFGENLVF